MRYQSVLCGMLKQSHDKEQTVSNTVCNCEVPGEIILHCLDYISWSQVTTNKQTNKQKASTRQGMQFHLKWMIHLRKLILHTADITNHR